MRADETIDMLADSDFIGKLYDYAYKRCESSHEAEDLCSDIVLALLKAIRQNKKINSFYAYAWTVAHRKYADYCEKRGTDRSAVYDLESLDKVYNMQKNPIDDYLDDEVRAGNLKKIMREISFLSRLYRDVMVMYYLDGMKVQEIASKLNISENVVKQRLFSARNFIKNEVEKVDTKNLTLKPVMFVCHGDGDPVKSNPYKNTTRSMSQNVLYLCKDKECTAKEVSEALNVPLPFIEEELNIQCYGSNGNDGMLKKLDNGKYISTFIMLEYNDYQQIRKLLAGYLDSFTDKLEAYIEKIKEQLLRFPFLNRQEDIRFILWSLIYRSCWSMGFKLSDKIISKFYSNIKLDIKDYYPFVFIVDPSEKWQIDAVGCDGVDGSDICGYKHVHLCNIYDGFRKVQHFHCGLNISATPYILLTIRSIYGLDVGRLSEAEKETAAKALDNGFLKKEGNILLPKILVLEQKDADAFYALAEKFSPEVDSFAEELTDSYNELIKRCLPKHLYGQIDKFITHTTVGFVSDVIDKCIERGILYKLENHICAEGTFMIVDK